jgi:hypothetical protein
MQAFLKSSRAHSLAPFWSENLLLKPKKCGSSGRLYMAPEVKDDTPSLPFD